MEKKRRKISFLKSLWCFFFHSMKFFSSFSSSSYFLFLLFFFPFFLFFFGTHNNEVDDEKKMKVKSSELFFKLSTYNTKLFHFLNFHFMCIVSLLNYKIVIIWHLRCLWISRFILDDFPSTPIHRLIMPVMNGNVL